MTDHDVQAILRRLDRIEALTNERLDRFEARLQRLEQRDDFRDEAFTEVLERLARIEATLQSGAAGQRRRDGAGGSRRCSRGYAKRGWSHDHPLPGDEGDDGIVTPVRLATPRDPKRRQGHTLRRRS